MSEDLFRLIGTLDDAPEGAFVIGVQHQSEAEYRFLVSTQLHNHPFPGAGTEEFYSQVIPAVKKFEAETHTPTLHTQLVLDALGDANLYRVPLFDYSKGIVIDASDHRHFSSFVRIHLESNAHGWRISSIARMTTLLASVLNPQKLSHVILLST